MRYTTAVHPPDFSAHVYAFPHVFLIRVHGWHMSEGKTVIYSAWSNEMYHSKDS